jgi:hypothetical protein
VDKLSPVAAALLCSIGELEVGRRYELVVSNLLGFFR